MSLTYLFPKRSPDRALASDYIHPYKDAGDVAPAPMYGSTSLGTISTLPWLSARSYLTTLAAR